MPDIEIRERGLREAVNKLLQKSGYFEGRIRETMQRLGNTGIETLKQTITDTGIQSRTGALLRSIHIKEITPHRVVIGFSEERDYVAEILDKGATVPGQPTKAIGVYALEKGPGEGVVFRRAIPRERIIRPRNFMDITKALLQRSLPPMFDVEVRRAMK